MTPNSRGDMASAGITNAPSGATIMKSRITANCKKASEATTNVWYGVKRLEDFLSEGGMRDTRWNYPNDIRPPQSGRVAVNLRPPARLKTWGGTGPQGSLRLTLHCARG